MAEVVGIIASAVSIASLFKACVGAFDLVQAARHQGPDLDHLLTDFNTQRWRLPTWGDEMKSKIPSKHSRLNSVQFRDLVKKNLQRLQELLDESKIIAERYGCREAQVSATNAKNPGLKPISAASVSHPQSSLPNKRKFNLRQKARWAIQDRKKLEELNSQIRASIDDLQEITKPIRYRSFRKVVNKITLFFHKQLPRNEKLKSGWADEILLLDLE